MFLHQFGVILASSFSVLSAFPVGFLGGICAFLGHFCVSEALFFEDKFCAALAEPQCCTKLFFKNIGLLLFHFIFVSHCLACSGWQKLSRKKQAPAQERTRETHRSKPERQQERQRKQKRKKPKWPQIAKKHQKRSNCTYVKLVQTNMSEIHHTTGRRNLYCWKTSQNGDCLLLYEFQEKDKRLAAKQKVLRGIRGPQGPSHRKIICFSDHATLRRVDYHFCFATGVDLFSGTGFQKQTVFRRLGPWGPLMLLTTFPLPPTAFFLSLKFIKE